MNLSGLARPQKYDLARHCITYGRDLHAIVSGKLYSDHPYNFNESLADFQGQMPGSLIAAS